MNKDELPLTKVLARFFDLCDDCGDRKLAAHLGKSGNKIKAEHFLSGGKITLRTNYKDRNGNFKQVRFGGLSLKSANQLHAYQGFLGVTVEQHFYTRHRIKLSQPELPCVVEYSWSSPNKYYPIEVLVVQEGKKLLCRKCGGIHQ